MDIKYELLADTLSDVVRKKVEEAFANLKDWTEATSMVMLYEIWEVIEDKNLSDSDIVKRIADIYKKHNVDCSVHSV